MMKFELDQIIHYIRDNRPHSAPIISRKYVDNEHDIQVYTKEQKDLFIPYGKSGTFYFTCHGEINEEEAFSSKKELADSILNDK